MKIKNQVPILIADDDQDDCMMIKEALQESRLLNQLQFVHDGEELIKCLETKSSKGHQTYCVRCVSQNHDGPWTLLV